MKVVISVRHQNRGFEIHPPFNTDKHTGRPAASSQPVGGALIVKSRFYGECALLLYYALWLRLHYSKVSRQFQKLADSDKQFLNHANNENYHASYNLLLYFL